MFAIHAIAGSSITIITAVMALIMIKNYNWIIYEDVHAIIGTIVFIGVFFVFALGVARAISAKQDQTPWVDRDGWMKVGKAHKICGFIFLIVSQIACLTGLVTYVKDKLQDE
jgi:hypothetical protein